MFEGGFSFENCSRNAMLQTKGFHPPKATKTGTTIVGLIAGDCVILGADTRATSGNIVEDKNCSKIHYIQDNIYCCGAGTAADTEKVTKMAEIYCELHRLNTGRTVRVITPVRYLMQYLFRYQGYIGAYLIVGGYDQTGPHLNSIHANGSVADTPYLTMGSGSLAAMAVFESRFKSDMTKEDGIKLVRDAIAAGIFNDLGSGSNVDICVISKEGTEYIRPYDKANIKEVRKGDYKPKLGSTAVMKTTAMSFDIVSEELMETS